MLNFKNNSTKTSLILVLLLFLTQSCTVNNTLDFYKDKSQSMNMDVDLSEILTLTKAFGEDQSIDNISNNLNKLPTGWNSFYDAGILFFSDGQKIEDSKQDKDSLFVLKNAFIKANKQQNILNGFTIKYSRFNRKNLDILSGLSPKDANRIPMFNEAFKNWDGKTLLIDTDKLNTEELKNYFEEDDAETPEEPKLTNLDYYNIFKDHDMLFTSLLNFEGKITSIQGKHDWFKQINDHQIQIQYHMSELYDDSKKWNNKDKTISVITE